MTTEPTKDDFLTHEALDRSNLMVEMINSHLVDHPALTTMERIMVQTAVVQLCKVYQSIGARS